jgi:hypothetical protein
VKISKILRQNRIADGFSSLYGSAIELVQIADGLRRIMNIAERFQGKRVRGPSMYIGCQVGNCRALPTCRAHQVGNVYSPFRGGNTQLPPDDLGG